MKRSLLLTLAAVTCQADRIEPRKLEEYSQKAALPSMTIASEFLAHSYSGPGGKMFFTDEYFVVEAAVFPAKGETVELKLSQFQLRLNGKKFALFPQNPEMVAASVKYTNWVQRPHLEGEAGAGDGSVIVGRPPVDDPAIIARRR